jgi:hypothetical protein
MDTVAVQPAESMGRQFISGEFIPKGKNEYYLRNRQLNKPPDTFRELKAHEVELLIKNGNTADRWEDIRVADPFEPDLIMKTEFFGLVRIGSIRNVILEHHDLQIPTGITNSRIIACDIGYDVAIHDVRYLAHYIINDRCILLNIDEMHTTNHAKFGNGIIKDGEPEKVRIWLDLMNETGCRGVLPFNGMIPADAYLWAKYRDDISLQKTLKRMTQNRFDSHRGYYGTIAPQCVIKHSRIIKDVKIGDHCYIKGANKLKNLTINSTAAEPTQIGEGVELVNGIVGSGCHIFYGCKAVRFILGSNANLKYGARLINSFLGDNATISCCEVLNNLIFPAHEQHHNNSFLIASVVKGQSNLAAGATIGSNHNSRANDNEIEAGRGFWPGLCTSVKHSCRFASFVLLAKADYPAEMDIPFPFSLLNNNVSKDQLEIMPAYWWLYNMYALARNAWKFQARDKRQNKMQHIEFDALAPDTVEEIFHARTLMELWAGKSKLRKDQKPVESIDESKLIEIGRELLANLVNQTENLEILGENMEKSRRKVVIKKAHKAYHAYGQMLHYYAVNNILDYLKDHPQATLERMHRELYCEREKEWINLGGQLVPVCDVDQLRSDIGSGRLANWDAIHKRYDQLWKAYLLAKQRHAYATLLAILKKDKLTKTLWHDVLDQAVKIQTYISDQVFLSRKKDYDNPFRQATYRNMDEMKAAIGTVEDNDFIKQVREETSQFKKAIATIKKKL